MRQTKDTLTCILHKCFDKGGLNNDANRPMPICYIQKHLECEKLKFIISDEQ